MGVVIFALGVIVGMLIGGGLGFLVGRRERASSRRESAAVAAVAAAEKFDYPFPTFWVNPNSRPGEDTIKK